MGNSNIEWMEWQKLVIREEYKDIKPVTPARDKAERQVTKTAHESLKQVKLNVRN